MLLRAASLVMAELGVAFAEFSTIRFTVTAVLTDVISVCVGAARTATKVLTDVVCVRVGAARAATKVRAFKKAGSEACHKVHTLFPPPTKFKAFHARSALLAVMLAIVAAFLPAVVRHEFTDAFDCASFCLDDECASEACAAVDIPPSETRHEFINDEDWGSTAVDCASLCIDDEAAFALLFPSDLLHEPIGDGERAWLADMCDSICLDDEAAIVELINDGDDAWLCTDDACYEFPYLVREDDEFPYFAREDVEY